MLMKISLVCKLNLNKTSLVYVSCSLNDKNKSKTNQKTLKDLIDRIYVNY